MEITEQLRFRDAQSDDLSDVLALYESSGVDAPGDNDRTAAGMIFERIRALGGRVLLAIDADGAVVATLTLFILPLLSHRGQPEAVVESVAVHPQAQGRGVGRALMQQAMQIARAHRCYKLALSSNVRRTRAHAFYDRLGFERHGVSFVVRLEPA